LCDNYVTFFHIVIFLSQILYFPIYKR